jgi:hypothetical protein
MFQSEQNGERETLLQEGKLKSEDAEGLSTLRYDKLDLVEHPLYTWVLVRLPPPPKRKFRSLLGKYFGKFSDFAAELPGRFALSGDSGKKSDGEEEEDFVY